MKSCKLLRAVPEAALGLPRVLTWWVILPSDEVLDFVADILAVENGLDFVFGVWVDWLDFRDWSWRCSWWC